jgi:hypothetical protein
MRQARPNGTPLVIEMAGLPGAGKTSITDRVTIPHVGRRDVSSLRMPLRRETWAVARAAMALAVTIRPWNPSYLLRPVRLVLALRCYGEGPHPLVIMDQGLVQKLWSMIIEKRSYSERRLEQLVLALSPFVADHLVWVGVPHELASRRIAQRQGGNSRFDGMKPEDIDRRLINLERVYQHIIAMFRRHVQLDMLTLDGDASLDDNAKRVEELISSLKATGGQPK